MQIVNYDDLNKIVTRLKLQVSSQNTDNSGENNEIISILKKLRKKNLILKYINLILLNDIFL